MKRTQKGGVGLSGCFSLIPLPDFPAAQADFLGRFGHMFIYMANRVCRHWLVGVNALRKAVLKLPAVSK